MPASSLRAGGLLWAFAAVLVSSACSVASIPGGDAAEARAGDGGRSSPTSTAVDCAQRGYEEEDVTKLSACECKGGGQAHCVAKTKIPDGIESVLMECDGAAGACIPDTLLAGKLPTTCESAAGEGRCLSLCVKKVAEVAGALDRGKGDACPADERCVPCVNPSTGERTGICDLGKKPSAEECAAGITGAVTPEGKPVTCPFTGTPADVTGFTQCAPGGRCVKEAQIDAMLKDETKRAELKKRLDGCDGDGLCVPEEYIREYTQHKPTRCTSFAGIEGRCFSTVFKDIQAQREVLQKDVCQELERCVPCFNPATGEPTGACTTVSCDAAVTTTAPTLKDCCNLGGKTQGKCLLRSDVPTKFHPRLSNRECSPSTELCVPSENLDPNAKPIGCSAGLSGSRGVCVSDCIQFGFLESIVLGRGVCPAQHTCVPCVDPKSGLPTGAPGC